MSYFLGIDAGTTSLKAALFDEHGRLQAVSRQEYTLETPRPAWVELDPEVYWLACCGVVRQVIDSTAISPGQVHSLCISSQGETLIVLDQQGQPLRRAIVWLDNRAVEEARWIGEQFDPQQLYHATGQPESSPTWPASKLLWLRRHEPEVFHQVHKFLLVEDYLLYRLTGRFVTESAVQSSSLWLDVNRKAWWQPMFDCLGISPACLGELLHPGDPIGSLSEPAAQALGLSARTEVVCGGLDQVLGALGAGNLQPGIVSETTGGALGIVVSLEKPIFDPGRRIPCHCHATRAGTCLLPWGQTAGMALTWFRDAFFIHETQQAVREGREPYDQMLGPAAGVSPGSEGMVVLPHLEGAGVPELNPRARAVFYGATLRHTRAHFVRAILESIAYMLRKNLAIVESMGVEVREVRSMGGGARSPLWLQIKADVLQRPVARLETEEAALLGAAMLGAVATGVYTTLEDAATQMVRLGNPLQPVPANAAVYDAAYARYLELYQRLAPMFQGE